MRIIGEYSTALVYSNELEDGARDQIKKLLDQDYMFGKYVRIMPDVHQGIGCVIGFTCNMGNIVIPNIVGVDIGCGMLTVELGRVDIDLVKLDEYIRKNIPSGTKTHRDPVVKFEKLKELKCYDQLKKQERFDKSIGTLGGGNHFIEVGKDSKNLLYLIIHSGSRNLGKQIADYYQKVAIKNKSDKYSKELCYLEGNERDDYLHDMNIAQEYAKLNREVMAEVIVKGIFNKSFKDYKYFHTVHNYIDFKDNITRKGAIAAYDDQLLLIPINMRDGSLLAKGKGNMDWNYSAPHGAGRVMSRKEANDAGSLEEFRESMKGVYSTSIHKGTLDESPFAYKSMEEIIGAIEDTVDIIDRIVPVYNFKA